MNPEKELRFLDLIHIILKKWYILAASLLIFTSVTWIVTDLFCPKLYLARAVIYLYQRPQPARGEYQTDVFEYAGLLKAATNRAYKDGFAARVSEKLVEAGYTPIEQSDIFISYGAENYDYAVEVASDSPEKSTMAANEALSLLTWGIYRDNTAHVIYPKQLAELPTELYRPLLFLHLGFGGASGAVFGLLLIFCRKGRFPNIE